MRLAWQFRDQECPQSRHAKTSQQEHNRNGSRGYTNCIQRKLACRHPPVDETEQGGHCCCSDQRAGIGQQDDIFLHPLPERNPHFTRCFSPFSSRAYASYVCHGSVGLMGRFFAREENTDIPLETGSEVAFRARDPPTFNAT